LKLSSESNAAPSPRIVVVFRNDDPSALSDVTHERRLFEVFEHWNVPQTIGVIPNVTRGDRHSRHDAECAPLASNPAMIDLLVKHCAKTGAEIALHGFTHQTNRFSIPSRRFYFEFARLPLAEQEGLLREGAQMIEQATGARPRTFIPPWNRLDANTVAACENAGFTALSTHVYVPAPQSKIVPFGSNSSLPEFASHLEAARRSERRVFIHVLLHTPSMTRREDQQLLDAALRAAREEPACEVMTIAAAAGRFADELREFNHAGRSIVGLYEEMNSARARAHVYARGPFASRLTSLQASARDSYRAGNYMQCIEIDQRIERSSANLTLGMRIGALFAAVVAGSVPAFFSADSHRLAFTIAGLATLWLLAAIAIWRATSPDTRRELSVLAVIASLGWLLGSFGQRSATLP
jgi:predicted deacetylase